MLLQYNFELLPIAPGVSSSCVDAINKYTQQQTPAISRRLPHSTTRLSLLPAPPLTTHHPSCPVTTALHSVMVPSVAVVAVVALAVVVVVVVVVVAAAAAAVVVVAVAVVAA